MIVFGICVLVLAVMFGLMRSYEKSQSSAELERKRKVVEVQNLMLERDPFVLAPLDVIVRQAEMVAEEEWRQETGEPVTTSFSDCINCSKTAIYTMGRREPVAWVLTDGCRVHRQKETK